MTPRALTLVLPYYDNPGMFARQQAAWAAFPADLRARLHVVVVDDASPRWPALPHVVTPSTLASFALYRTGKDVRWNWIFCRNLGVHVAPTDWVLLTDIDHLLPVETLRRLLDGEVCVSDAYRLSRVDAPHLTPYKPHPNTWFLHRRLFDEVGGYDERFSGYYGTDGDFRRRMDQVARKVVLLPDVMMRVPREVVADASTTTYTRKEKWDKRNVHRIVAERADIADWRPLRLSFPYERLL
jgi:hypothetical protein